MENKLVEDSEFSGGLGGFIFHLHCLNLKKYFGVKTFEVTSRNSVHNLTKIFKIVFEKKLEHEK